MDKKKSIAVAVVLLFILIIGGMLAYFTDTDTATNTFTLGDNIEISLVEANWDPTAAAGIHPGTTVAKDPVISNDSATTPAYVFAKVTVPCYASTGSTVDTPLFVLNDSTGAALGTTVGSAGNTGWTLIQVSSIDTTNKTIDYIYAWGTSSAMTSLAANTDTTTPVFSSVTLKPSLTYAQQQTAPATTNIVVNAYGIQTDGLGTNTTPTAIYGLFSA